MNPIVTRVRSQLQKHLRRQKSTSTTILCFGDSNTWGYDPKPRLIPRRIPDGQRWTDLLEQKLTQHDHQNEQNEQELELEQTKLGKVNVLVDALNARTTIYSDPAGPCDGEYNCNGRDMLMTSLHTHKPLDVVVLALGTNDLKKQLSNTEHSIASGVRILARDIMRATNIGRASSGDDKGVSLSGSCPEIVIVGVPKIKETPSSLAWGFHDCGETCEKLVPLLREVATSVGGHFVNLQQLDVEVSPLDGVHFDVDAQEAIAEAVSGAVRKAMQQRRRGEK